MAEALFGEQHPVARRPSEPEGHVGLAAGDEPLDRVVARRGHTLADRLGELVEDARDNGHHDCVPVGEVRVDRGSGDPDLTRDGAERHRLVGSLPVDERERSGDDLVAQTRALSPRVALASRSELTSPLIFEVGRLVAWRTFHKLHFTSVSSYVYTYNRKSTNVSS